MATSYLDVGNSSAPFFTVLAAAIANVFSVKAAPLDVPEPAEFPQPVDGVMLHVLRDAMVI